MVEGEVTAKPVTWSEGGERARELVTVACGEKLVALRYLMIGVTATKGQRVTRGLFRGDCRLRPGGGQVLGNE